MNKMKKAGAAASVPSKVAERVEALLGRMSLEEKIGQLNQVGGADFAPGPRPRTRSAKAGLAPSCGSTTLNASTSCKRLP